MIAKRRCPLCAQEKELTLDNFCQRIYQDSGRRAFRSECRECRKAKDRKRQPRREHVPKPAKGRDCRSCAGMPWRVPGICCPSCGLRYAQETLVRSA